MTETRLDLLTGAMDKSEVFVKHIETHLKEMNIDGKVICKICGKDIDTIYKESEKVDHAVIFIDGSCKGNPGPGEALALIQINGGIPYRKKKESKEPTTNNRMEYEALLLALKEINDEKNFLMANKIHKHMDVTILTDSKLICGHMNENWKVNVNQDLVDVAKGYIKLIRGQGHTVTIQYIPREENKAGLILEGKC